VWFLVLIACLVVAVIGLVVETGLVVDFGVVTGQVGI